MMNSSKAGVVTVAGIEAGLGPKLFAAVTV